MSVERSELPRFRERIINRIMYIDTHPKNNIKENSSIILICHLF
ncbi:MAG: hypothetical protein BAJALOKI3v1_860013 [Promethearchaeota archaeon]|nr:MAG: hypothetical protein BAJALOKI3v1_860013 [Candidatus Lokiarchaeota archaeon]